MFKKFLPRSLCLVLLLGIIPLGAANAQGNLPQTVDLRIMTFNIWLGGELVDFDQVVAAIKAADADIVGLQEAMGNTRRLADALGWSYASESMQIISRFPLIDPPGGNGLYIFAQIQPGAVVALANFHLPSDPYGPYAVRDGATRAEVLALERATRLPMIEPYLPKLMALTQADIPVLLTGDFNTPSHRDWTAAMIENRIGVTYTVSWPVSSAVEGAGFVDTYRVVHADPVEHPGITWTYGYPYPRLNPDEMVDRIDFVFAAGAVEVLKSQIVGETGTLDAEIGISPYPSDHRAVVSTVRVTPGRPPYFVAAQSRVVKAGEPIVVRYHAPTGEGSDRIILVPAGGDPINDPLMWLPPYEANFWGSVTFGSTLLTPGAYEVVLVGIDNAEIARHSFWIVAPDARPAISLSKPIYKTREAIHVTWQNAPAYRWDWIAIYLAGDPDLINGYWGYLYTQATVAGQATFDSSVLGKDMLPPGEYEMRLLMDDGFSILATAAFTVTE